MATTWGSDAWGDNSWASNLNTIDVNGINASFNIGQAQYVPRTGWSGTNWNNGEWGELGSPEVIPTGISISGNLGSPLIDTEVNLGWGSDTWGTETWGISGQNASLTGIALSSNLGSVTTAISADVIPTGEEITGNTGTLEAFASFTQEVTGISATMTLSFDPEIVTPAGQELTSSLGTATLDANTIAEVSTTVTSYYGSATWGFGAWGNEPIETLAMTSDEGTVDPSPDASVTGIGFSASLAVGTVVAGNADVTVIGEGIAAGLGLGTIDLNTPVDLTGIAMSASVGSVTTIGEGKVTLTGLGLTSELGTIKSVIWNQVDTGTAPVDPPGWVEVAA